MGNSRKRGRGDCHPEFYTQQKSLSKIKATFQLHTSCKNLSPAKERPKMACYRRNPPPGGSKDLQRSEEHRDLCVEENRDVGAAGT